MHPDAIVLLAYGPPRVTAEAIERGRRLTRDGSRLLVVPAVAAASRGLRTHASALVEVVDGVGRAGLEQALDMVRAGTVLLIHDDVLVTAATMDAMVAEHLERGHLTTAWTNDTNAPNHLGMLPVVRRAEATVTKASVTAPRREVRSVRTGCLLASVRDLRALLSTRLTVARTRLESRDRPIVIAEGAVVAHDSTCVDQVAPPRSPDGRPLVTAALIVRDEAEMLPDCLASLDGLVDRIVVCDTGSTDDTIAIARAAGAEVIERPWRDDFGWARNEVLAACRDSWWILQVDADERIVCSDATEARRLLATDVHDSVGIDVLIENIDGHDHTVGTHAAPRLFRPDGVEYVGALHEMPYRNGRVVETITSSSVTIRHLGYRGGVVRARGKADRNVTVARRAHGEAPTGLTALQLARSLRMLDRDDPEVAELLATALEDDTIGAPGRAHALACLADQALRRGDATTAMEMAAQALAHVPSDAEAGRVHAEAGLAAGRLHEVVAQAQTRHRVEGPTPLTQVAATGDHHLLALVRTYAALDDLAAAGAVAHELLDRQPSLDADQWQDVISVLLLHDGDAAIGRLRAAAVADPGGSCVEALCRTLSPGQAAEIAAEVIASGTPSARAVRAGLVAATVADRPDLAAPLAGHADVLDSAVVDRLVEFAIQRGAHAVADELESGAFFPL